MLSSPLVIAAAALALRLATIVYERTYLNPSAHGGWTFGYEVGQIAFSLTTGHGFAFLYPFARPTAQVAPAYPLLMAAVFKIFGRFTETSAFVMFTLDSVFSALTCITIFLIAKQLFGGRVAAWSAWAWAVLPQAIYWSTHSIWYTSVSALLLSVVFLLTLRLRGDKRAWKWCGLGLVWALIFLTNPSLVSFLPVSLGWLAYQLRGSRRMAATLVSAAVLAFLLGISPWVIRNYYVLGTPVFSRTDLGEELWAGNHEAGNGLYWTVKPWSWEELRREGELAYMAGRREKALQFIRSHPSQFAIFTLRRVGYFWCGIPLPPGDVNPDYIPFYPRRRAGLAARHALYFGFALLAFWGLAMGYRRRVPGMALFAGLFLLYPLVYYITHCHPRYQFPIVPEMLMLAAYLLHTSARQPSALAGWRARRRKRALQATAQ